MTIEDFKVSYLRLCKDHHVEPQDVVLHQLSVVQKQPKKHGGCVLNLSTNNITTKTCAILGKVLASDRTFTEVKLNDCMITEEGMRALAHGVATNVACKKIDMKGNNVRGTATEALGRMLKNNKHLLSLCFEWNAMGMIDTSFGVFCEALGSNSALQVLDLRNNQISHDGASELGQALKRNTTLRALDLRWNNVGLIGSRSLLSALEVNRSLIKLELAGNNVPNDILKSIDTAILHNQDRANLTSDYSQRQHMLSEEIQTLKKTRLSEMSNLMDRIDQQDDTLKKTSRGAQQKIYMLQEALEDRKQQFDNVASKLSLAESEMVIQESKVNELGAILCKSKEEQAESIRQHQVDLKREREEKALGEAKLNKEIIEINERNMQLENQIDELERKCRSQQENIFELKEQLTHLQAESKMKASQMDERLQFEKQKTKEAFRDAEMMKLKEIDRIRRDTDDVEKALKERTQRLEMQRIELEEEISRHKSQNAQDKLQSEEMVLMAKQKMKNEEEQRTRQFEEKIRMLQTSRDDIQGHANQQSNTISELQTKNANLTLENETLKRKIEDLTHEVAGKNNEIMAEVGKVKLELNQKIEKMESERKTKSELYDKIGKLEKDLSELNLNHTRMSEQKDREIMMLTERLKSKEAELSNLKETDEQRTNMLTTAIQSYVTRSPFSSTAK